MAALPLADDFVAFSEVNPSNPSNPKFRCIYPLVQEGRPCKNKIASRLLTTTADIKKKILEETSSAERSALLREFIRNCCCKRDHREKVTDTVLAEELLQRWRTELDAIKSPPTISGARTPQAPHGYGLRSRGAVAQPTTSSLGREGGASIDEFEPMKRRSDQTLVGMILRPLSSADLGERNIGELYAYQRASSRGVIKIGCSVDTNGRMRGIKSRCKYEPTLLHCVRNVPYMARAETFVHYELLPYWRRELKCNHGLGCNVQHQEWFQCSIELATRSMDNFSKWLVEAEPYDGYGFLKSEWKKFIEGMERAGRQVTSQSLLDEWERLQQSNKALSSAQIDGTVLPPKPVGSRETVGPSSHQPVTTLPRDIEEQLSNLLRMIGSLQLDLLPLYPNAKLSPWSQARLVESICA